ncbi:MAG TPA: hypothetical protein VGO66_12005 [Solirubrobacterales bacterium]|jgi:hypothetical protein|nr:hypothetical protein [Solirubrobacterales bacterium]
MPQDRPETLDQALLGEAVALKRRIEAQGAQAERLRLLADRIDEQTQRDRALLQQLESALGRSIQLSIDDLDGRLRGQRLLDVAITLLEEQMGRGQEIHYRDWFQLLQSHGYRVGGKDPLGTFLAQINRADIVESVGKRTGRYRLRAA